MPIPPNQDTVNSLFDANVHSEEEMEAWLSKRRVVNEVRTFPRTADGKGGREAPRDGQ